MDGDIVCFRHRDLVWFSASLAHVQGWYFLTFSNGGGGLRKEGTGRSKIRCRNWILRGEDLDTEGRRTQDSPTAKILLCGFRVAHCPGPVASLCTDAVTIIVQGQEDDSQPRTASPVLQNTPPQALKFLARPAKSLAVHGLPTAYTYRYQKPATKNGSIQQKTQHLITPYAKRSQSLQKLCMHPLQRVDIFPMVVMK